MTPPLSSLSRPHLSPLPGEDGQMPVPLLVSKDLSDILPKTQREAILIRAGPKDWRSKRLCRQAPLGTEKTITEETTKTGNDVVSYQHRMIYNLKSETAVPQI